MSCTHNQEYCSIPFLTIEPLCKLIFHCDWKLCIRVDVTVMGGSCNGQIIEPYSCNPFFMAYSTPKLKILVPISISSSSAFQRYPNFPILINYQGTFGYFKFVSTFNRLSFTKTNSLKEYSKFYISGSKLSKVTRSTLQWAWASLECVEQFKIPSKLHKDSLQT